MEVRIEPTNWKELSRQCSYESLKALKSSLASLEAGRAPTPSFKLYGKTDISVATDFLSSLRKTDAPQWMLGYEETRLAKFGPQGGYAPWAELEDDFILYQERLQPLATVDEHILRQLCKKYASLNCRKLAAVDTLTYLIAADKIQDRAAGWNTFQLKKTDPKAQQLAVALAKSGRWKDGSGYVFSRYNKQKKRIFMPMPFSSMIAQAQYFVPFLSGIQDSLTSEQEHSPFVFWADKIGFDKQNDIITNIIDSKLTSIPDNWTLIYVQRDFEKMDTTTGTDQYKRIFIPMLNAAYHGSNPTDLQETMLFTTRAPIITPTGTMIGDHGTASGAEVTNGGETCCNEYYDELVHQLMLATATGFWYRLYSAGNGDDGYSIYAVKYTEIDRFKKILSTSADRAAKLLGFRVQSDKWHVSEQFGIYCQNMAWYDRDGHHFAYPAVLILNSIINPEREYKKQDWDKDYRDLDIIQKLDNGKNLPYFHKLVDYVMAGTKYPLLGSSESETQRILSKYDRYRELQPLDERYNRQDYKISNSPTVEYVLSKRSG